MRLRLSTRYRRSGANGPSLRTRRFDTPTNGAELKVVVIGAAVRLSGDLDFHTQDLLAQTSRQLIHGAKLAGSDVVLVDATNVRFIDAAGLGALVGLSISVAGAGLDMRIPRASGQLRRLSALCQVDGQLGLLPMDEHGGRGAGDIESEAGTGPVGREPHAPPLRSLVEDR